MVVNVELSGKEINVSDLDHIMENAGFIRWAWDYDHATYDFKYEDVKTKNTYYLRVVAYAVDGRLDDADTVVRLEEPHIGKHLFPHGLDYEANIPSSIMEAAKKKLLAIKEKLV